MLLFDAHKLDISDEFKEAIEALRGNDDKIRVVLNKADLPMQQLMRVYGALMWSLGKVFQTPEVVRVFIGSFWDREIKNQEVRDLLEAEHRDLLADLRSLPRNALIRKMDEMCKRAKTARVHGYLIGHLRDQFGFFTSKENKQKELLKNIFSEIKAVRAKYNLPMGDLPNPNLFRDKLSMHKIYEMSKLDDKKLGELQNVLANDILRLMRMVPEMDTSDSSGQAMSNPFSSENATLGGTWLIDQGMKTQYDNIFNQLAKGKSSLSGTAAKDVLLNSQLPVSVLHQIWALADITKNGSLDSDEFSVCMYLIDMAKKNKSESKEDLPQELPPALIPPSKRNRDL